MPVTLQKEAYSKATEPQPNKAHLMLNGQTISLVNPSGQSTIIKTSIYCIRALTKINLEGEDVYAVLKTRVKSQFCGLRQEAVCRVAFYRLVGTNLQKYSFAGRHGFIIGGSEHHEENEQYECKFIGNDYLLVRVPHQLIYLCFLTTSQPPLLINMGAETDSIVYGAQNDELCFVLLKKRTENGPYFLSVYHLEDNRLQLFSEKAIGANKPKQLYLSPSADWLVVCFERALHGYDLTSPTLDSASKTIMSDYTIEFIANDKIFVYTRELRFSGTYQLFKT
jgi:hypothetical protein